MGDFIFILNLANGFGKRVLGLSLCSPVFSLFWLAASPKEAAGRPERHLVAVMRWNEAWGSLSSIHLRFLVLASFRSSSEEELLLGCLNDLDWCFSPHLLAVDDLDSRGVKKGVRERLSFWFFLSFAIVCPWIVWTRGGNLLWILF